MLVDNCSYVTSHTVTQSIPTKKILTVQMYNMVYAAHFSTTSNSKLLCKVPSVVDP